MESVTLGDARIRTDGDRLILENSLIRRELLLAGSPFVTVRLVNKRTGREWIREIGGYIRQDMIYVAAELHTGAPAPDPSALTFAGDGGFLTEADIRDVRLCEEASCIFEQPSLTACVALESGPVKLERWYQIYPGCPVTVCWTRLTGAITPHHEQPGVDTRGRLLREGSIPAKRPNADIHDSLLLRDRHLKIRNVYYTDLTDCNDNYVQEEERYSYLTHRPWMLEGNLLFAHSLTDGEGLFMLKESPVLADQPDHPDGDFTYAFDNGLLGQVGWGFTPGDLPDSPTSWRTVVGVFDSTEDADAEAVKSYLKNRCVEKPGRDWLLTCNQWGDRNMGGNFTEDFIRREVDACAELGIPAYMLDAGWQTGDFSDVNKVMPDGSSQFYDHGDYWSVNSEKFPNGLHGLFEHARSKGVELLFWFNPDHTGENRNYRRDAEIILNLYREYGAKVHKIDGVWNLTRKANARNRAFLEDVIRESGGEITFHLDITHGARWGYFYANHLGALFLENRYTHWRNYFPYKVHKNLWQLSRYLRPQRMLFEFLNNSPERGRNYRPFYPEDDPFTPEKYPIEYCFAVVMFSNPLAWFEPSNLSREQVERLAPVIRKYHEIRDEMFTGDIYPIGEKPSGRSITGFQSHNASRGAGFVCAYREATDRTGAVINLRRIPSNSDLVFELVMGDGSVGMCGKDYFFELPQARSFALFRYERKMRDS